MPDDYGYINGRIRVMRTELLSERTLDELSAAASYPEFLRQLAETPLAEDMRDAAAQHAGLLELDGALSRNFHRTAHRLYRLADGDSAKELGILVAKWDLINLKTLGRGLIKGRSSESIAEALIPGGTIQFELLKSAASNSDILSATQTLSVGGGKMAQLFKDAAQAYSASGEILDFEIALDQGFYTYALSIAKHPGLRRFFAREIDIRNAMSARQVRGSGSSRYFVPGGSFSESDFLRLVSGDVPTHFGELDAILEATSLEQADTASRELLDQTAASAALSDALGPGIAADFLRRKETEIAQLRLIGRGKYYGVSPEQLKKGLSHA